MRSLRIDIKDEPLYDQIQIDKLEEASWILDRHHLQEEVPQIQNDQLKEASGIVDSHCLQEEVPQIQNDQLEEASGILDSHCLQEEVLQIHDNYHQQQEVAQSLTCKEDQHYELQQEETSKLLTHQYQLNTTITVT